MKVDEIGTRLRVLRAERRVSQLMVSATTGISHNRYWRMENGFVMPTAEEARSLAEFFGIRQKDLRLQGVA